MSKATPTPWHLGGRDMNIIYGPTGYAIANALTYHGKSDDDANAAHIVLCVNEREGLLLQAEQLREKWMEMDRQMAACLSALKAQEDAELQQANCQECMHTTRDWSCCAICSPHFGMAIDMRRAALSRATGAA